MDDAELKERALHFYAASVNAWYASALEHDKSLFALSSGGIALMVTLLTTVGFSSRVGLAFFALSIGFYLVALGALLTIFRKNQRYIETVLTKGSLERDPLLATLDLLAIVSCGLGTLFAAGMGLSAAIDSFSSKRVGQGAPVTTQRENQNATPQPLRESFNGAGKLQSGQKSFNGASGLQPVPSQAESASTPTHSQAHSPAPAPAPDTKNVSK